MKHGIKAVVDFLTAATWEFKYIEEKRLILFDSTNEGNFQMAATTNEDDLILHIYTIIPIKVLTPAKQTLVAEFCVRAAGDVGCFEFDMDGGGIRFHASAPYSPETIPHVAASVLIGTSLLELERYYPALHSILYDGVPPKAAIGAAKNREIP